VSPSDIGSKTTSLDCPQRHAWTTAQLREQSAVHHAFINATWLASGQSLAF